MLELHSEQEAAQIIHLYPRLSFETSGVWIGGENHAYVRSKAYDVINHSQGHLDLKSKMSFQNEWVWAGSVERIDCDLLSERTGMRNICNQFPHNPLSNSPMKCLVMDNFMWSLDTECDQERNYFCEQEMDEPFTLNHKELLFDKDGGFVEFKPKFLDHDGVHTVSGREN